MSCAAIRRQVIGPAQQIAAVGLADQLGQLQREQAEAQHNRQQDHKPR